MILIPVTEEKRAETAAAAEAFLKRIRPLLKCGECSFSRSEKNIIFDRMFPLKHQEKVDILLSLSAEDCVKIAPNDNPRYADSQVYVFLKSLELLSYGEKEMVRLYIKMYLNEQRNFDIVIVISFHQEGMHGLDY